MEASYHKSNESPASFNVFVAACTRSWIEDIESTSMERVRTNWTLTVTSLLLLYCVDEDILWWGGELSTFGTGERGLTKGFILKAEGELSVALGCSVVTGIACVLVILFRNGNVDPDLTPDLREGEIPDVDWGRSAGGDRWEIFGCLGRAGRGLFGGGFKTVNNRCIPNAYEQQKEARLRCV